MYGKACLVLRSNFNGNPSQMVHQIATMQVCDPVRRSCRFLWRPATWCLQKSWSGKRCWSFLIQKWMKIQIWRSQISNPAVALGNRVQRICRPAVRVVVAKKVIRTHVCTAGLFGTAVLIIFLNFCWTMCKIWWKCRNLCTTGFFSDLIFCFYGQGGKHVWEQHVKNSAFGRAFWKTICQFPKTLKHFAHCNHEFASNHGFQRGILMQKLAFLPNVVESLQNIVLPILLSEWKFEICFENLVLLKMMLLGSADLDGPTES